MTLCGSVPVNFQKLLDITDSQVRQDLSCIGEYGRQGYGYNVRDLLIGISNILGINDEFSAIIIGTDTLAIAIALILYSPPRSSAERNI